MLIWWTLGTWGWLLGAGIGVRAECGDLPGEQFLDTINGVVGDAGEHVAQVAFRVEAVQFGSADRAVEAGGALSDRIGASEKAILPAMEVFS